MVDENITKKEFEKYVSVQMSGVTNMFDVTNVEMLSGLNKSKILNIMENYSTLSKKYKLSKMV